MSDDRNRVLLLPQYQDPLNCKEFESVTFMYIPVTTFTFFLLT